MTPPAMAHPSQRRLSIWAPPIGFTVILVSCELVHAGASDR